MQGYAKTVSDGCSFKMDILTKNSSSSNDFALWMSRSISFVKISRFFKSFKIVCAFDRMF